jgi:hypothetical protein
MLNKDAALELLALSLNNIKGFPKKVMIFSEIQALRGVSHGLVRDCPAPGFEAQ